MTKHCVCVSVHLITSLILIIGVFGEYCTVWDSNLRRLLFSKLIVKDCMKVRTLASVLVPFIYGE